MSGLISLKDVLHELDWCDYGLKDWQKWKLKMMVRDIPFAQPEQRWIPVTERLPDKKGYYLVTRKNPKGHVTRVRFNPEQVERGVYNSPWGNGDCDILAWMPLPDAFEGDD